MSRAEGTWGEALAAQYLRNKHYTIVNYYTRKQTVNA